MSEQTLQALTSYAMSNQSN